MTAVKRMALYGSLYLDRGERFDKALEQITDVKTQRPAGEVGGWFFDIIFDPKDRAQETIARRYVEDVEQAIHAAYADEPDARFTVVVVALSARTKGTDPRDAPGSARSMAIASLHSVAEEVEG